MPVPSMDLFFSQIRKLQALLHRLVPLPRCVPIQCQQEACMDLSTQRPTGFILWLHLLEPWGPLLEEQKGGTRVLLLSHEL